MQCPPGTPQLLCRPIDQSGDFAIKLGQVQASQTVVPAAVWTETRGRLARVLADTAIVHVKLSQLQLRRPRQWGACWLALMLWRELQLDQFWSKRLGSSRKGTHWDQVRLR